MEIDRIEKDPDLEDIIWIQDISGARISYRMSTDHVLRPGRVWRADLTGRPEYYRVTLFLPLPDGPPEVLRVERNP